MARSEQEKIAKLETGIAGLDLIANGGLPAGRSTLVGGTAGSAKTVLAMHGLHGRRNRSGRALPRILLRGEPSAILPQRQRVGLRLREGLERFDLRHLGHRDAHIDDLRLHHSAPLRRALRRDAPRPHRPQDARLAARQRDPRVRHRRPRHAHRQGLSRQPLRSTPAYTSSCSYLFVTTSRPGGDRAPHARS